jgi:hypothetical protein
MRGSNGRSFEITYRLVRNEYNELPDDAAAAHPVRGFSRTLMQVDINAGTQGPPAIRVFKPLDWDLVRSPIRDMPLSLYAKALERLVQVYYTLCRRYCGSGEVQFSPRQIYSSQQVLHAGESAAKEWTWGLHCSTPDGEQWVDNRDHFRMNGGAVREYASHMHDNKEIVHV